MFDGTAGIPLTVLMTDGMHLERRWNHCGFLAEDIVLGLDGASVAVGWCLKAEGGDEPSECLVEIGLEYVDQAWEIGGAKVD